jgi:hypothetical protein
MQIDTIQCIDPSERRRDETYFVWAYRWGYGPGDEDVTDAFVGTFRARRRTDRNLRRGDSVRLNAPIIPNWFGTPHGIMNGVLALVEEDGREDFNARSWGARKRRARRLERYIDDRIDAHGRRVSPTQFQTFLEDGIREHAINDDLIQTCPLLPGTHDIRGAGGHYRVTLEIV